MKEEEKEKKEMAKNWTAYEAAKALYGNNTEEIVEIGSRFPVFTRTVSMANSDYVLDILKAIPKVTARVVETGLKGMEEETEEEEVKAASDESAKEKKGAKKEQDSDSYESMTSKELYKLCCERGISSKCKSRSKAALIELLEAYDNGEFDEEKEEKETKKETKEKASKKGTKKTKEPEPEEDEDWGDEDEEEEEVDPYEGKTAKELYKMCMDRGIKTKPKQSADAYVKLLKKADEEEPEEEDEDEDDDEWEI